MMSAQNKARARDNVAGIANKSQLNGSFYVVKADNIINHLRVIKLIISRCENLTKLMVQKYTAAYNAGSKNRGSTRPVKGGFVLPLIIVVCHLTRRALSYGGVGQEQSPRCPRQLEHPHHIGGLQSKNRGGHHA